MLKRIIILFLLAIPMMAVAQTKIGVYNEDSIYIAIPEIAKVENKLQAKSKMYEGEIKKLQEELQRKYTEYQALEKDESTPTSIKERRIQEIQELDTKYQQFIQTAQRDIKQQQQQLLVPIKEKVLKTIKTIGKENKFTAIFPQNTATYIGEGVIDITPLVLEKLGVKK